jgi:hypothetical protein
MQEEIKILIDKRDYLVHLMIKQKKRLTSNKMDEIKNLEKQIANLR